MKIYLAIFKNKFYAYKENFAQERFDDKPYFSFEPQKIRVAITELVEKILDKNKLASIKDLQFVLIESSDAVTNEIAAKSLGNSIIRRLPLNELIHKTAMNFAQNPGNYIFEFGVNYDGECYRFVNGKLQRGEYSLLARPLEPENLLNFVE